MVVYGAEDGGVTANMPDVAAFVQQEFDGVPLPLGSAAALPPAFSSFAAASFSCLSMVGTGVKMTMVANVPAP